MLCFFSIVLKYPSLVIFTLIFAELSIPPRSIVHFYSFARSTISFYALLLRHKIHFSRSRLFVSDDAPGFSLVPFFSLLVFALAYDCEEVCFCREWNALFFTLLYRVIFAVRNLSCLLFIDIIMYIFFQLSTRKRHVQLKFWFFLWKNKTYQVERENCSDSGNLTKFEFEIKN